MTTLLLLLQVLKHSSGTQKYCKVQLKNN